MPNEYHSVDVVCPYYRDQDKHTIMCEGIGDRTTLRVCYPSRARVEAYQRDYCNSMDGYKECPIATMLNERYNGTITWTDQGYALDVSCNLRD